MSKINRLIGSVVLFLSMSIALSNSLFAGDQELTAEKVVAEHLKSIGNPATLGDMKSRVFVGTGSANFIQGMSGSMTGTSMFVSEGRKLAIVLKFGDLVYPGEYFAFDEKDVSVAYMSLGQRSPLADFIFRYNGLIKGGFIGGVISNAWPLLDQGKKADMKYKYATVDGKHLHMIEYQPKSILRDVRIRMYFDPETFHHLRTEYQVQIKGGDASVRVPGTTPNWAPNATQEMGKVLPDSIYVLVEKFDDFKEESGLTLPHKYSIDYSVEGQGHAFMGKWTMEAKQWQFNSTFNESIFKAQK